MPSLDELARQLDRLCDERPYRCTWALHDLRAGTAASRGGDEQVPAASTRKVAIMLAALTAVARGELELERPVTIDERYRQRVFTGTLQHLEPGLVLRLRDAITLMIVWSDNLATAHVVDLVGLDEVNALCERLGLVATVHRHALIPALPPDHSLDEVNVTSAADQAALYHALVVGARDEGEAARIGCDSALCRLALEILRAQQHRDLIPALLPLDAVVAHKTGLGWRDASDGGIVYRAGEPRFVLTAYADGVPAEVDGLPGAADARLLVARLARACWDALG